MYSGRIVAARVSVDQYLTESGKERLEHGYVARGESYEIGVRLAE